MSSKPEIVQPPSPAVDPEVEDDYKLHRRFDRIGRLVGDAGMERLLASHVVVIGLGGVGSYAAEALVRSGVGAVTLVDFDLVCVTNSNRQLQALQGMAGKPKADVLADRLRLINPQARVKPLKVFYRPATAELILGAKPDFVVDAIDNISTKCHLVATCRERQLPVVCSTGASARLDPTQVRVADLAETRVDPLAQEVRKILRQKYGFPSRGAFGIPAVFSPEPPQAPRELTYDGGRGFRCVCPGGTNEFHSCEDRPVIWGTAGFVTGAFGFACASVVVRALADGAAPSPHADGGA